MKKILIISIMLLMVIGLVNPVLAAKIDDEFLQLDVEKAILTALQNNLDLQKEILKLEQVESDYEQTLIAGDQDEIEKSRENLQNARFNLIRIEEDLKLAVKQSYRNLLKREDSFIVGQESLQEVRQEHALNEIRYEKGHISELSLKQSSNNLFSAILNHENQQESLLQQRFNFLGLLGLPFEIEFELAGDFEISFQPLVMTLNEALEIAFLQADSIISARENLKEAAEKVRLADNEYTPLVKLQQARRVKKQAEIDLNKTESNLYLSTRSDFFNLQQLEKSIELRENEIEIANINYTIARAQYQNGDISEATYLDRKNDLKQAKEVLSDAKFDYLQDKNKFLENIGAPAWLSREEVAFYED